MGFKGADKHIARLRKLSSQRVVALAGAVVFEGADTIRAEAFRSISAGSISGAGHQASAPGDAPNREFGDLQAGLKAVKTGALTAEFRAEAPHSKPLEFGTSKMAARPFARPARDKKIKEIRADYVEKMNKLVKASG
ncbi:HK97-gp10 family putative phage morphogenesis protein [Allopontixanthobacter sediminis]|uniref:HK97 gp10 family phage protein n=1 Tax=Allopontixanthobacter sediminis TaxID=1689985 RepID=A0A845AYM7_9SPHN|nr:HK97-gp10 family putative phage morphogenesis protein [Allopontixanthobacter sediminis]MXP42984.1 HK97 gp10 family phage protein [Allopontixanthobacter sediminis]